MIEDGEEGGARKELRTGTWKMTLDALLKWGKPLWLERNGHWDVCTVGTDDAQEGAPNNPPLGAHKSLF